MSLDGAELRYAVLQKTEGEISQCESRHLGALRQLFKYHTLLTVGRPPQTEDWVYQSPSSQDEATFLEANNLAQGRHFNDASLPLPSLDVQQPPLPSTLPFESNVKSTTAVASPSRASAPSLEEQLRAASASPAVATPPVEPVDPNDATRVPGTTSTISKPEKALRLANSTTEEDLANGISKPTSNPSAVEKPNAPAVQDATLQNTHDAISEVEPQTVLPPTIEDEPAVVISNGSAAAPPTGAKSKAPQTAHLPNKETQEARLSETEEKLEKAAEKERKEEEKLGIPNGNSTTDLVSSPSSTVGPYSQATPHAPHHSPDTSPDTESFRENTSHTLPSDDTLDPAAQQVKEDHERALQKELRAARQQARKIRSPTPDVEKQLEDEQAIRLARDGKGRSSETNSGLLQHAKEVVKEVTVAEEQYATARLSQDPAADSLPTPTTIAPEPSVNEPDVMETNIDKKEQADSHPTPPAETDVEMRDAPRAADSMGSTDPLQSRDRTVAPQQPHKVARTSVAKVILDSVGTRAALTPRSSPPRPRSHHPKSTGVSTVVFAKKSPNRGSKALQLYNEDYASLLGASEDSSRDYLEGLFKYQAHHPPRSVPLQELVSSARKTVTTAGALAMIREHQDYKILKRIYQLQSANRWSLRQIQKAAEPERPFSHHDYLLLEMKWMNTDFREERKWKKALASTFAGWCANYIKSSPAVRASLRVKARIPQAAQPGRQDDEDMADAPTPDLEHSHSHETESESLPDDDELLTPLTAIPPASIFSLDFGSVVMKIDRTPASDTMFRELPFYEPMLEGASDGNPFPVADPPILPVSKYVTGKLVSQIKGPPRKRSRFDYDSEDEPSTPPSRSGTSAEHSMPSTPGRRLFCRNDLPPEMTDVALFNAENKHVRDRLQAAHQFRPPTEFNMPSVSFFENRIPSQWLWEEDQKLRALVKEYTFNWSLVSQQLSLPSLFVSGSGRRTPWECFERWVQLEGLPAEMSKTQYFRTYQGRLEQANKTVFAQYQAAQQQQPQQGQAPGQTRRRPTTTPIRVERRRDNRHLAIIDAMRKLARKRESAAHKQAESQKAAALRKAHEPAAPKNTNCTPQEFSRLKWEREEKLRQRQQQQEMAVRQQMAAQRQAQMQGGAMPNAVNQMQRNGTPGGNNNLPSQMGNTAPQQGQNAAAMAARAHPGQPGMQGNFANANMAGMPMGAQGVPQAQMQGNMQNAQRMAPPDQMRAMAAMQRGQMPTNNQQLQFQLQQQLNMANMAQNMGMNNMPNTNMMGSMANQNLAANMNVGMNGNMNGNMNGSMNAGMNGMSNNAGSPRVNQVNGNMQTPARPLSSGHMPGILQLQNSLKVQHPEWTQEQVQKVASEQLSRFLAKQQRVQAMNAAAGSSVMSPSPQIGNNQYLQHNGAMANSPSAPNAVQNYQRQLVQTHQNFQNQRQASSPGMSARPPSRSATPQNPQQMQQSPGMQQAQVNRS